MKSPALGALSAGDADKQVCGYVRCSSNEQAEHGYGLDVQHHTITRYCKDNSLDLVRIYEDAGLSGAEIHTRPALLEMLQDIRKAYIPHIAGALIANYLPSRGVF